MSKIEELLLSKDFTYLEPYFYNNPYALRCELGVGDTKEKYLQNAKSRALEIYKLLFPKGADAVTFNYWMPDYSNSGEAEKEIFDEHSDLFEMMQLNAEWEKEKLEFLSSMQHNYRHAAIKNLPTYDDPEDEDFGNTRRNRIICYSDGKTFNYESLIELQLNREGLDISFVSFENEYIFSIYDERGCDVVFATHGKMKQFYPLLEKYFLAYDLEEMQRRYENI